MNAIQRAARKIAEGIAERDTAIRAFRAEGQSLRQLAEWAGVSKDTVATITRTNPKENR